MRFVLIAVETDEPVRAQDMVLYIKGLRSSTIAAAEPLGEDAGETDFLTARDTLRASIEDHRFVLEQRHRERILTRGG